MHKIVSGINAVRENIKEDKGIVELFIAKGRKIERLKEILDLAREKSVSIKFKDKIYLDKLASGSPHQGIIGILGTYRYFHLEDLIKISRERKDGGLLLAADHITDTGNLGSLISILPKDRCASITSAVHKSSAGGSAYLPVARVVNIARTLKDLGNEGFWIVGAAGESTTHIYEFDWRRDLVLVLGSEDKGVSRIVRDKCHHLVCIPRFGHLDSLNVSVAAGIILSEIVRQRGAILSEGSL